MTPYSVPTCPHTAAQQGMSPDGPLSASNTTTALIHISDTPCHDMDYDMVPPSVSSYELPPSSPVFLHERETATPPPSYTEVVMSDLYRNPPQVISTHTGFSILGNIYQ